MHDDELITAMVDGGDTPMTTAGPHRLARLGALLWAALALEHRRPGDRPGMALMTALGPRESRRESGRAS